MYTELGQPVNFVIQQYYPNQIDFATSMYSEWYSELIKRAKENPTVVFAAFHDWELTEKFPYHQKVITGAFNNLSLDNP